jgi:hypothetical protein
MVRVAHPGRQASRGRVVLAQPRHPIAWWVHTAAAVENHGCHGLAWGPDPRVWRVAGGTVHDRTQAKGIAQPCDPAHRVEDVTPLGVWQGRRRARGEALDPEKFLTLVGVLRNVSHKSRHRLTGRI